MSTNSLTAVAAEKFRYRKTVKNFQKLYLPLKNDKSLTCNVLNAKTIEMSRKSSKNTAKDDANEKNSAAIREYQASIAENKKCFECEQRGPTYVNMTIGSFVCTKCSGML